MKKWIYISLMMYTCALAQPVLTPPMWTHIAAQPNAIYLQWQPVAHADGYEIILTGTRQQNFYVGNNEIGINEHIIPGAIYGIYARSYAFEHNNHSAQSIYWVLTPPLALPAKINAKGLVACWKRKLRRNEYYFYLSTDSNFEHIVMPYNGLLTCRKKYKVSPLDTGTYYYRIGTMDALHNMHYSNAVEVIKAR